MSESRNSRDVWAILTGEYPPQPGGVSDYTRLVARALAAAGDEVHVWAPRAAPAPTDPGVTIHRLPDHFGASGLARLAADLRRLPPAYRLLVQYVPQAFGWRGMNLLFCLWLWSRRRDTVWVMFHEVVYPFRLRQPLRHNLLAVVTRLMAMLVGRASRRTFVSVPAWGELLARLVPGRRACWLPVPSTVGLDVDAGRVARVRERAVSTGAAVVVGHFGTFGGHIAHALRAILPRLAADVPEAGVILAGRGSDAFLRRLVADHPSLGGQLVATGELPGGEVTAHLAACDLLLQPYVDGVSSRRTSLMAGLALGLPVVTTEGPLTEPLWRESGAVALAPAEQPERLGELAAALLRDPAARRGLGERARRLYAERFDLSHTIRLLRDAARESPGRRRATGEARPVVAFLVNGDEHSAMGHRARAFAAALAGKFDVRVAYRSGRKVISLVRFVAFLRRVRPAVAYVFDVSYSGVLAAVLYRAVAANRLVVDTGDAIYELSKSIGRGPVGRSLTWALEAVALRASDHVVVRGSYHRTLLAKKRVAATFIPDGVHPATFPPHATIDLRGRLGFNGKLTVGVVGSSVWSPRLGMCYGWELVELIRLMKDEPVRGIFVGDGTGIERLRAACREHGIESRVHFAGRVPYEQLPEWLAAMDVCLSTQTNDVPGRVRTTGKLPVYLAAGRYVLASRVGEAANVLPEEMLVDYHGVKDDAYPARLAQRVRELLREPRRLHVDRRSREIARRHFDYAELTRRLDRVLTRLAWPSARTTSG